MTSSTKLSYFQPAPFCLQSTSVDVYVYGATSGGITAAIEAAERSLAVTLIHSGIHIGGFLGIADSGNKQIVKWIVDIFMIFYLNLLGIS